jgi:hypothetical protein
LAWTDECVELEWLELACVELPCVELACECVTAAWLELEWLTLACTFAFACAFAFEWVDAFDVDFECVVCPGAFAEFPCVACACCASCFFSWPGALPELPGEEPCPFPATALPLNAIAATATANTPPKAFLGRCIASPDLVDKSRGGAFV